MARGSGATAERPVRHAYISKNPKVCGGSPVITGTRFSVRSVVQYVLRQGMTPEELVQQFPHLTLAQVYDAISYYYDHTAELNRDIRENSEEHWQAQ